MKKTELEDILNSLGINVAEGEAAIDIEDELPKAVFWDYDWQDVAASGKAFQEVDTYQVSFIARKPRDKKLLEFRKKLREAGILTHFIHEYVPDKRVFHSSIAIEVITNDE